MSLTALEIKNAREGMHADGNGLYLRVQKSGAKSWIFRFQLQGKRREMGIGTLTDKTAPVARAEAAQLAALVRAGTDPIKDRHAKAIQATEDAKEADAETITFRAVAADYIASHRAGWSNAKHAEQWANTLETYAAPVIGDKPIRSVNTDDVLTILKPIWNTKTETATRVRSRIELILSYAKALRLRQGENPALWRGHLDALLPKPTKLKRVRHHSALPYDKTPAFVARLREVTGLGARALEFVILTAARSGEVRLATWAEIDLKTRLWTIPAARMKAKREHLVPLSSAAMRLLEALPRIDGSPYLFPGSREQKPLSDMSLTQVIRRLNERALDNTTLLEWIDPKTGNPIVPHGFRSTFRDWTAEQGNYPREVCEHALAHSLPDKVEAAYQRGVMLERRRPMMQSWADYLEPQETMVALLKDIRDILHKPERSN
ncbi:tyrosine-type recombinase/integrase [Thiocystis violascens]|uniref:Integrase n=1 Tax=Thiocystis violascens (strain ATCC 17096 / DSM 198 / 6111) TaxID=765911 RepID=I3Y6N5_THIV6|nr:Integrase [Thiocystis violascens DSM 198]